ncbi:MAG: enoyl-CoA hydratase/isomerase family protein [Planctomycetota bacterium]|jgi:enoyl-CoA hydratase/carnithine racemase
MSTTPLPFERFGDGDTAGVGVLRLDQPGKPVVVLERELLNRLDESLATIGRMDLSGFVLASASSKVFVAGADLKEIDALDDPGLHEYLEFGARVFSRVSDMPWTTVAAINGAALGGGLELAMHCDHLVGYVPGEGERPYPVGLPEAGLGLCPGWGGTNMLPARIDPASAIQQTATGKPMLVHEANESGLFAETTDDADALIGIAARVARREKSRERHPRWIGEPGVRDGVAAALERVRGELPDTEAARCVGDCVACGLERGWEAAIAMERERLVGVRHTEAARGALEAFFAKSKARASG